MQVENAGLIPFDVKKLLCIEPELDLSLDLAFYRDFNLSLDLAFNLHLT